MSHDRGCYVCGEDRASYEDCTLGGCPKRELPKPKEAEEGVSIPQRMFFLDMEGQQHKTEVLAAESNLSIILKNISKRKDKPLSFYVIDKVIMHWPLFKLSAEIVHADRQVREPEPELQESSGLVLGTGSYAGDRSR